MKKWIGLLCSCLIFSNTCSAYTSCTETGGEEITAKDGSKFCKSKKNMSWYAAHAWCYANGGKMATFTKMCPGITFGSSTKCDNLKKNYTSNVWVYINVIYSNSFGRLNLKDGSHNKTNPVNRCVGTDRDCELSSFGDGTITDMFAFCE